MAGSTDTDATNYNRMKEQALHVRELFGRLLGAHASLRLRSNGIWLVSCCNVEIAAWVSGKERQLLEIITRREEWRREWLQALFDDEGHVHISRHVRRVRASQDNAPVLISARRFLKHLGISSRIDSAARALEITGRENLVSFRNTINFSPGIRVNGHRKNGLWKRSLEKRQLLDLALSSYERSSVL